jgi:hypothetical protein
MAQSEPNQSEFAQPAFTLQTSAVTLAELDGDCQRHALLPGRIEVGAVVPCPDGDHEHRVLDVLHTEAAENVRIIV